MKTYVTTILTISLFFVISCQKGKQEKSPEPGITEWQPAYLALGENITEQERLSFCFKNEEKPVPPLNRIYPEHFGGIYRCPSDRTKTVICLTDTSEQTKQHIIELCQLSREGYVFQKCDFSKNEMLQIMRKLNDIPNLYEEWSIIDIGISSQKNKVDIHFYGAYDENKIRSFQEKVLNHPALVFTFALDNDAPSSLKEDEETRGSEADATIQERVEKFLTIDEELYKRLLKDHNFLTLYDKYIERSKSDITDMDAAMAADDEIFSLIHSLADKYGHDNIFAYVMKKQEEERRVENGVEYPPYEVKLLPRSQQHK